MIAVQARIKWSLILISFSFIGCVSRVPNAEMELNPTLKAKQEAELQPALEQLEQANYQDAAKMFIRFQHEFPSGYYYQKASMGLAQAYEAMGEWDKAASLYRSVVEATREKQPEIAGVALYLSSFSYEALGDETRVLSSLKDAETLGDSIAIEQRAAEIPARISAFYQRIGEVNEARKYLDKAQEGLKKLKAMKGDSIDPVWLARTLFMMGQFQVNQVSSENLQPHIDTLLPLQVFLMRSVEANGAPWSRLAKESMMRAYLSIWNTVQSFPLNRSLDRGAAEREKLDRQLYFVGEMLRLMNELRDLELPDGAVDNVQIQELNDFMGYLYQKGKEFLVTKVEFMPLTQESLSRLGLKREGVTISEPFFDIEKRRPNMPTKLPMKNQ
jgi:tetratricopeptide (TPR) repeat protein